MKYHPLIHQHKISIIGLSLVSILSSHSLSAHPQDEPDSVSDLGVLEITGRASDLLGRTDSASSGVIGQAEFEFRPLSRPGELVELVPGMMATQHSGSGKANQYFLRGFNLDHGTDFSGMVDGVPLNLPSHGHGQGYLDLNSIIPELVDIVEFGKGPYHAEMGDFSSAGYVRFHTKHRLDKGLIKFGYGENDYYRGVLANSHQLGDGDLLYGAEVNFYEGPWDKEESLNKFNGLLRYTVDDGYKGYAIIGTAYKSNWDSTEQIPSRAVNQGYSELGTIDPTAGGDMERYSLAGNWWKQSEWGETELSAYAVYSDFNLYSNFTYFLNDPINGDQITQRDRRYIFGGEGKHTKYDDWFGFDVKNIVGLQVRHDYIPNVALYKSKARKILSTVTEHEVSQTSIGIYLENEVQWAEKFKSIVGLRGDFYEYDVNSRQNPINSGQTNDAQFSPKLSLIAGPWYDTEYYFNMGYGFHSNDARATTIQRDPNDLTKAANQADPISSTRGAEIGMRNQYIPGLVSTISLWWLELDSELVFTGDGGSTEALGKSRRYGIEISNYYKPFSWLTLDFDVALSQSEFTDAPSNAKDVPNSVGRTISGGATVDFPNGLFGSLRARHFGDMPLTEDGSIYADSTTIINLGTGYRYKDYRIELNVLNLFDSGDTDIAYYYESRLAGETAGVNDVASHPVEPRTVRVQMTVSF